MLININVKIEIITTVIFTMIRKQRPTNAGDIGKIKKNLSLYTMVGIKISSPITKIRIEFSHESKIRTPI